MPVAKGACKPPSHCRASFVEITPSLIVYCIPKAAHFDQECAPASRCLLRSRPAGSMLTFRVDMSKKLVDVTFTEVTPSPLPPPGRPFSEL